MGVAMALGSAVSTPASSVIALPIADQFRASTHVVIGDVTAQRVIEDATLGVETEVTLEITLALKGLAQAGETLTFATRGGVIGDQFYEAIGEAQFETGRRVLVFLEEIEGRLYVAGLSTGAWNVVERANQMMFSRALQGGLEIVGELEAGPLSLPQMQAIAQRAQQNPQFESEFLRRAMIGRQP